MDGEILFTIGCVGLTAILYVYQVTKDTFKHHKRKVLKKIYLKAKEAYENDLFGIHSGK